MKKLMTNIAVAAACALCMTADAAKPLSSMHALPEAQSRGVRAISTKTALSIAATNAAVRAALDSSIAENIKFFGTGATAAKTVFVDGLGMVQLSTTQLKGAIKPSTYPSAFAKAVSDQPDEFLKQEFAFQKVLDSSRIYYRNFNLPKACQMYKYVCYSERQLYSFKQHLLEKVHPYVYAYVKANGVEFNGQIVKSPFAYKTTSMSEGGKTEIKVFDPAKQLLDEVAAELDAAYLGNINTLFQKYGVNATIDTSFLPRGEELATLKAKVAAKKANAGQVLPCMSVDEYNTFVKSLKK